MKKLSLIFVATLIIFNTSQAQDYPKMRYLSVNNDNNIRINVKKELCVSCSDYNFIVDGDESKGYIELDFIDVNSYGKITKAELIMNVSDAEYSESGHGFSVYVDDTKVGNISNVARNRSFIINLDAGVISKYKTLKLSLKANGKDGLYLLSKKSGYGAVLKLQY